MKLNAVVSLLNGDSYRDNVTAGLVKNDLEQYLCSRNTASQNSNTCTTGGQKLEAIDFNNQE